VRQRTPLVAATADVRNVSHSPDGKPSIFTYSRRFLIGGNCVRLLKDALEKYPAWLNAIHNAKRYIHFESYISYDDSVGQEFGNLGAFFNRHCTMIDREENGNCESIDVAIKF
jgi:phosphatidylserine/phosphatidylglycerophosphate/cardiolipin synthase-like enzyme